MATISIRNIDDSIYKKIKYESKEKGISINKFLLQILYKFFNPSKKMEFHDLDDFFGTWTEEEHNSIKKGSMAARKFDDELWK